MYFDEERTLSRSREVLEKHIWEIVTIARSEKWLMSANYELEA